MNQAVLCLLRFSPVVKHLVAMSFGNNFLLAVCGSFYALERPVGLCKFNYSSFFTGKTAAYDPRALFLKAAWTLATITARMGMT